MKLTALLGLVVAVAALGLDTAVVYSQNTTPAAAQEDERRFDKIERPLQTTMAEIGLPDAQVETLRVTLNPGTKSPTHRHTGRMSIDVVIQGELIEHRGEDANAMVEHVRKAGDVYAVPEGTQHFLENRGTVPVIYAETNLRAEAP